MNVGKPFVTLEIILLHSTFNSLLIQESNILHAKIKLKQDAMFFSFDNDAY